MDVAADMADGGRRQDVGERAEGVVGPQAPYRPTQGGRRRGNRASKVQRSKARDRPRAHQGRGRRVFEFRKFFPVVNTGRPRQKNFQKKLVCRSLFPYLCLAQFRTCLWSCVGWRGSDKRPINRQFQPAAGGEPANPAKRGTRLEATTDRAFSSLSTLHRSATEEACLSCRACGRGFPFPIDGFSRTCVSWDVRSLRRCIWSARCRSTPCVDRWWTGRGWPCPVAARVSTTRANGRTVPAPFLFNCGASRRQKGCRHDRPYRRFPP